MLFFLVPQNHRQVVARVLDQREDAENQVLPLQAAAGELDDGGTTQVGKLVAQVDQQLGFARRRCRVGLDAGAINSMRRISWK